MAGTDFSTRTYSYDDVEGDVTLSNFNLAEEDFVYKVILYSLYLLKHSHMRQCGHLGNSSQLTTIWLLLSFKKDSVRQLGPECKLEADQIFHQSVECAQVDEI